MSKIQKNMEKIHKYINKLGYDAQVVAVKHTDEEGDDCVALGIRNMGPEATLNIAKNLKKSVEERVIEGVKEEIAKDPKMQEMLRSLLN